MGRGPARQIGRSAGRPASIRPTFRARSPLMPSSSRSITWPRSGYAASTAIRNWRWPPPARRSTMPGSNPGSWRRPGQAPISAQRWAGSPLAKNSTRGTSGRAARRQPAAGALGLRRRRLLEHDDRVSVDRSLSRLRQLVRGRPDRDRRGGAPDRGRPRHGHARRRVRKRRSRRSTFGAFSLIRVLSTRNDDPATASRPFDRDRDGFVMAEGSRSAGAGRRRPRRGPGRPNLRGDRRIRHDQRRLPHDRALHPDGTFAARGDLPGAGEAELPAKRSGMSMRTARPPC